MQGCIPTRPARRDSQGCVFRPVPAGSLAAASPPPASADLRSARSPRAQAPKRQCVRLKDRQRARAGKTQKWCEVGSRPVSRVLSRAIIPLGTVSPRASSGLPGSAGGYRCGGRFRCRCFPIWPCSRWGLPCRRVLPPARCALTAPFHPYRSRRSRAGTWAVCFLLHFPWARAPQALPGTSSAGARTFLPSRTSREQRLPSRLPTQRYGKPATAGSKDVAR